MNTEIKESKKIKDILSYDEDDSLTIMTHNLKTNEEGFASFLNTDKGVRVYEGKEDGSEDKNMSYEKFLKNYSYKIERTSEVWDSIVKENIKI